MSWYRLAEAGDIRKVVMYTETSSTGPNKAGTKLHLLYSR